jgi:hypothetical protein
VTEQQTILWVIIGVILLLVVVFISRKAPAASVRLVDIPAIFEKMRADAKDESFALFGLIPPGGKSTDDVINIQFSRENGRLGVDWVLICPRNIADKEKFVQLAQVRGQQISAIEAKNGVKFLRVEDGDLPGLLDLVLRELYAVPPDMAMELTYAGFAWP